MKRPVRHRQLLMGVGVLGLLLSAVVRASATPDLYFDYLHGLLEERAGHTATALADYEKIVRGDPQAREVYRDIAELQLRLGHAPDAVSAAIKAKDISPKDPESYLFLGNVYLAQGDLAKAAEAYEQTLKLDPTNLQAMENLGNYYSVVDPSRANGYYQRYLDQQPNASEIYFRMGLADQKAGNDEKAVELFKKSSSLDPIQPGPHLALAAYYELKFSTAAAVKEYETALQQQPQNPVVWSRLGRLHYDAGEWDEAGSAFQNARSVQPGDPSVHYWLARVAEEQQRWKDAADQAEEAYRLSQDPQFLPLISYYLTLDHRSAEAIPYLEKARKAQPKNANVYLFLGMNQLDLNHADKAKEALTAGLALEPKDVQMHFQLGIAEDRLNHFDAATAQFETVIELDPANAPAMNYLGYSWADHGIRLEEAETLLRKAITLDPSNGAYMDSLGWALFKRDKRKESTEWLLKAVAATPDPQIYEHLGDVYQADGQPALARDAWVKASAMDPKNKTLRKKVDEASHHVLPGSDPRKVLKYVEGNNRQILHLKANVDVNARYRGVPLKTLAQWSYDRPDHSVLSIPGPSSTPAVQILIQGDTVQIIPGEAAESFKDVPLGGLAVIPEFFSGRLLAPLDDPSTRIEMSKKLIHYVGTTVEAWLDKTRGVLTRFKDPRPASGDVDVEIRSYVFVEGLWLPEEIRLRGRSPSWKARLKFSDWQINQEAP